MLSTDSQPAREFLPTHTFDFETVQLNQKGEVVQRSSGQAQEMIEELAPGVQLELIAIPRGFFQMGSRNEGGYKDESPQHPVFLDEFGLGQSPVTQAQWQAVMGSLPDCRFHGPDLPVETICWRDAVDFCERLSRKTERRYSLPSEAQWEYACRAGTATPFSLGDTITTDYVNYVGEHTYREGPKGIYRHGPTPAGTFLPNPWGLYDMHGNVWEFCADSWSENYLGAPVNGAVQGAHDYPAQAEEPSWLSNFFTAFHSKRAGQTAYRVARGGSWHETPLHCRSAMRLRVAEDERLEYYGLRVALKL
jgi:formylglycine-generating enzyme required for sulfatase activity